MLKAVFESGEVTVLNYLQCSPSYFLSRNKPRWDYI